MMRSTNPALSNDAFNTRVNTGERMSFAGVFNKGMILFALMMMTFIYTWNQTLGALENGMAGQLSPFVMVGAIGGLIAALATILSQHGPW